MRRRRADAGAYDGPVIRRGPLSPSQRSLWLLERSGAAGVYHNVLAVELRGPLDRGALGRAVRAVAARHESLRTRFVPDDSLAIQEVLREPATSVEDLSAGGSPPDAARDVISRARAWASVPFSFGTDSGPPIRVSLTPAGPDGRHLLVIAVHHLISDGDSMTIILRELLAAYEACAGGQPGPLAVPPAQFLDVMARIWPAGAVPAADVAFWREQLTGAPAVLDLPLDRLRPARPSYRGAVCQRIFEPATVIAVRDLAREQRVTVFMTILASLAVLLTRLAGTGEVVLGVPVSLRRDQASRGTVGYLVNTIALRIPVGRDVPMAGLLAQVRRLTLRGYDRSRVPFSSVVREVRPPRRPDHHPVFQVLVAFTDRGDAASAQYSQRIAGLDLAFPAVEPETARTDVSFCVHEVAGTLAVDVEYATDLCDEATAAALAAALERVLAASARAPSQPAGALPLTDAGADAVTDEDDAPAGGAVRRVYARVATEPGPFGAWLSRSSEIARQDPGRVVLSCPDCAITAGRLHLAEGGATPVPGQTPCHQVESALRQLRDWQAGAAAPDGSAPVTAGATAASLGRADPASLATAIGWLLAQSPLSSAERVVLAGHVSSATALAILLARAIACGETFIGADRWASVLRADGSETIVGTSAALLAGWAELMRPGARLGRILVIGEPPLPQPWTSLAQGVGDCPVSYAGGPAELGGIAFTADVTAGICTGRALGRPVAGSRVRITEDEGGPVPPRLTGMVSIRPSMPGATARLCLGRDLGDGTVEMTSPLPAAGDPSSPPLCQLEGAIAGIAGAGDVHVGWRHGPRGRQLSAEIVPRPGTRLAAEQVIERLRGCLAAHLIPPVVTVQPSLPEPSDGWLGRTGSEGRPDRLGTRLLEALAE